MIKRIIISVCLILALQHILPSIYSLGYHKWTYNHRPGPCRVVPGIDTGSEDIHVLKNGLALISSGIALVKSIGHKTDPAMIQWKGRIYLFDFNNPNANVTELPILGDFDGADFRPHGISVWEEESQTIVFVANHKQRSEAIEVFQFDQQKRLLTFTHSITDPVMRSLNDVVAVGPDKIYFTNDGYHNEDFKRSVETLLKFHWGNVVYYDGSVDHFTVVVPRGENTNGINKSPDGKYIYVSSVLPGYVTVYERQVDNTLKTVQVINLGTSPDNIMVEEITGDLWIGCHNIVHQIMAHFEDLTKRSPSQVLRLQVNSKMAPYTLEMSEVYMDDGRQISGSSSGAYYKNQLLIGSVAHKLAYCQVLAV